MWRIWKKSHFRALAKNFNRENRKRKCRELENSADFEKPPYPFERYTCTAQTGSLRAVLFFHFGLKPAKKLLYGNSRLDLLLG